MVRTEAAGLLIGLTILGTCTLPANAAPDSIFNSILPQLKRQTRIPISLPERLPNKLRVDPPFLRLTEVSRNSYSIAFYSSSDCTAHACFRGSLEAQPAIASRLNWLKRLDAVSLQEGITGYFHPASCGASCASAGLIWVRQGTVYSINLPMPPRDEQLQQSVLVTLANSALQQTFQPR